MTKLQKLEAAARKWAEAAVLHNRIEAQYYAAPSGTLGVTGDLNQAADEQRRTHLSLLSAARELIR